MKYLIFNNNLDAIAFNHEVKLRTYPNVQRLTMMDVPYLFSMKLHPTTGEAALVIPDGQVGLLTEDEQADLVETLDASWTPPEVQP